MEVIEANINTSEDSWLWAIGSFTTSVMVPSRLWWKVFPAARFFSSDSPQVYNSPPTFILCLALPVKWQDCWGPDDKGSFDQYLWAGRYSPSDSSSEPNTCLMRTFSRASWLAGGFVEEDEDGATGFWTEEDTICTPVVELHLNASAVLKHHLCVL